MPDSKGWYEWTEDNNIMQGDLIEDCPIIVPPSKIDLDGNYKVDVDYYDVIVVSHSCDIATGKLEIVLVCPFCELSEFGDLNTFFKKNDAKEGLRRGYSPSYHLLNKPFISEKFIDYLVVNFRSVYGVHFKFLKNVVERVNKRLRLVSPYREHLSQAFARYFMRVGLPADIPPFSKKTAIL